MLLGILVFTSSFLRRIEFLMWFKALSILFARMLSALRRSDTLDVLSVTILPRSGVTVSVEDETCETPFGVGNVAKTAITIATIRT